ncbi:MAG: tetratricopeptide repeat protein [Bacteroidetes bacterium]|jgi:tol-pal system protein YbgF|nr:tetratricopeptide repeat protein [Bacteroidota bacterium]
MNTAWVRNGWQLFIVVVVVCGLSLTGCGGSEEAIEEEGQTLGEEPAQEASADDAALTSFVGAAPKKAEPEAPVQAAPVNGQLAQYEKQIEDLRTENTGLKQKIVKLEQDNRSLNTMMSDSESRIQAERSRADSLEQVLATQGPLQVAPVAAAPFKEPAPADADATVSITSYEEALQAFNAKKYDAAISALEGMLAAGVTKDLEDNCHYWIGESKFAKKQYQDAIGAFELVIAYAKSEKKGDAQYMIAQSYERLGNKKKAKDAYEKVVKEYPMSKVVKKAKERWARL